MVIDYLITGYLQIVIHSIWTTYLIHFGYLFVFVVLVSIMEGYLSAEDHMNSACTVLT